MAGLPQLFQMTEALDLPPLGDPGVAPAMQNRFNMMARLSPPQLIVPMPMLMKLMMVLESLATIEAAFGDDAFMPAGMMRTRSMLRLWGGFPIPMPPMSALAMNMRLAALPPLEDIQLGEQMLGSMSNPSFRMAFSPPKLAIMPFLNVAMALNTAMTMSLDVPPFDMCSLCLVLSLGGRPQGAVFHQPPFGIIDVDLNEFPKEPKVMNAAWYLNGSGTLKANTAKLQTRISLRRSDRLVFSAVRLTGVVPGWPELPTLDRSQHVDRALSYVVDFNPPRLRGRCQPRGAGHKPSRKCPLWRLIAPCSLPLCCDHTRCKSIVQKPFLGGIAQGILFSCAVADRYAPSFYLALVNLSKRSTRPHK